MVQFQDSISKFLNHYTLFNMFFDETFEAHYAWILSCYGPRVSAWLTSQLIFLTFWLFSLIFYTTFCIQFTLPHPSIASIPRCVCTHPINPIGIHFLCFAHGNECIGTHDIIRDIFVAIARDASFHVGREQLHALPSITLNPFRQQINIVFNKDGIRTLTNCHCRPSASEFTFSILCNSSQGKELLQLTPY
jgi:hypothetical protein